MKTRERARASVGMMGALIVVALAAGCERGGKAEAAGAGAFQRPPAQVTTIAAIASDVPTYLDEIGRCVPREMVSIQPQVNGPITAIHFEDGAELKKNDPLFTIDPRPYAAQAKLAEGNLAQSRAQRDLAKVELDRAEDLLRTRAGSAQDRDAKRGAFEVAAARVESDDAALAIAQLNLGYCEIRSPIDGRAGHRLVDLGNLVVSGSTALLVIQRLDPIYADFTITERELALVRASMSERRLRVEARAAEDDANAQVRAGELTFLDAAVNDGTGTVKLRATIPNADRFLWPGQFLKVRLVLGTRAGTVLVPARAAQLSQKGPFVFVVKDAKADLRPVKLGQRHGDLVAVEDGLSAGERVVVTGQLMLFPGAPVAEKSDQPEKSDAAPEKKP